MFFDILAVFIVSLISSLFLCTTSVHGLPSSPQNLQLIHKSSSLRLLNHRPVLSIDNDTGGDTSEMLIGESNEDDDDSSLFSLDLSDEPLKYYLQPSSSSSSSSSSSKLLFRKLLQQQQQKRSSIPQYNLHSAVTGLADPSNSNSAASLNQFEEPIRLSSSLKKLVETNPFARAWLTMLLQKLMQEQNVPYIFKYGRRRK